VVIIIFIDFDECGFEIYGFIDEDDDEHNEDDDHILIN